MSAAHSSPKTHHSSPFGSGASWRVQRAPKAAKPKYNLWQKSGWMIALAWRRHKPV